MVVGQMARQTGTQVTALVSKRGVAKRHYRQAQNEERAHDGH